MISRITLERFKDVRKESKTKGLVYARIKAEKTLDTRDLASHIAEHGSIYTYDTIVGVLAAAENCIPELLLGGYKMKLNGLGTFRLAVQTRPAETAEEFDVSSNLKAIRIKFLADNSNYSAWTKDTMRKKASFVLSPLVSVGTEEVNGVKKTKYEYVGPEIIEEPEAETPAAGEGGE